MNNLNEEMMNVQPLVEGMVNQPGWADYFSAPSIISIESTNQTKRKNGRSVKLDIGSLVYSSKSGTQLKCYFYLSEDKEEGQEVPDVMLRVPDVTITFKEEFDTTTLTFTSPKLELLNYVLDTLDREGLSGYLEDLLVLEVTKAKMKNARSMRNRGKQVTVSSMLLVDTVSYVPLALPKEQEDEDEDSVQELEEEDQIDIEKELQEIEEVANLINIDEQDNPVPNQNL